ncbi:hypothetical protein E4U32_006266 [Claviceps aff. humidiphila group G2b]|nr:hypothetical protein E4U32_006266 [Claviceps aff. humidiphila group G2b]
MDDQSDLDQSDFDDGEMDRVLNATILSVAAATHVEVARRWGFGTYLKIQANLGFWYQLKSIWYPNLNLTAKVYGALIGALP